MSACWPCPWASYRAPHTLIEGVSEGVLKGVSSVLEVGEGCLLEYKYTALHRSLGLGGLDLVPSTTTTYFSYLLQDYLTAEALLVTRK